jgi:hypothetical protein
MGVDISALVEVIAIRESALRTRLVCDAKTKIVPVTQLGVRTQEMGCSAYELKLKLKVGCVPVCGTDGLARYFYALTAYFGEWVKGEGEKKAAWVVMSNFLYAQVIKQQRRF